MTSTSPIRGRLVVAIALACLHSSLVSAQTAQTPDARVYPNLASLVDWLKGGSQDARGCATTASMTAAARTAYEQTKSEAQAAQIVAQRIVQMGRGKVDAMTAQKLAAGYSRTAVVFSALPANASGIAIAALCRTAVARKDRPFADEALQQRLIASSRACLAVGFSEKSTNPAPLECVVKIFDKR
ncbi:MAG TPA: hypothetical protein VNG69_03410 [Casimicrobiaceae bacterium]|nr:hypothetical protein [Casimicrobiaceae bacterium]